MRRILLIISAFVLFQTALQAQQVKEMYLYAVKGTDSLFVDRHVDWSRVQGDKIPTMIYMYGGGWAYGNRGGPYSKKFPAGWMPAGYIGYAGGIVNSEQDLHWNKKPCPMMFFHGSADFSVAFNVQRSESLNVFGPTYILAQLHEMEVPNWLYCEIDGDHVLSYKPFGGYNTHEIQTFVEKFVLQGLKLEMKTEEYNLEESSHLPGFKPVHSKNPDAEGMPNPNPPAKRP